MEIEEGLREEIRILKIENEQLDLFLRKEREANKELQRRILELNSGSLLPDIPNVKKELKELQKYWSEKFKQKQEFVFGKFLPKEKESLKQLLKAFGFEKTKKMIDFILDNFHLPEFSKISANFPTPSILLGWARTVESLMENKSLPNLGTIGKMENY